MPDNTILLDYGQRVPPPAIDGYLRSLASGQWWNGSGTEDFLLSHWTSYAVPLIEAVSYTHLTLPTILLV